ncbi:MAG: acetolactate synthase small subunit [Alphaproteobacteria bacterium]|nr:acetolactate synthase small subunit [Alphaproteobacteria bacterium]NDC56910.1 acetolactate synthase small subunit [Alphaproteobacteria bacterium]NDG05230.1 acetolactate synthase small subunit [Alphaproteobacteria bacterium]
MPQTEQRHCFAVLVHNEPGILARIAGLFSGRGYNIDSLTVSEVDEEAHSSRLNIVTRGTAAVIEQIRAQLGRLIPVQRVADLTTQGDVIERDLALLKVSVTEQNRAAIMKHAEQSKAHPVYVGKNTMIFELAGHPDDIDTLVGLLRPLGLIEISRTGVAAIGRGDETL